MLHGSRIASDEAAFAFENPQKIAVAGDGLGADLITVPDAHLLFNGDFQRSGPDLKIVGQDGQSLLVPNYFKGEKNPTLLSPEGAALTGDIVEALAGPRAPGQYAQAGAQTSDQPAIGRVEQVAGNATIVRNGVAITANQGDVVRKGDVVQTGSDGQIAVLFADGSTFSLSASARMVLNDFVYQSGGSNNSALISLVQGTIGFVAGQVAKTGDMRVETPVATMGIRGTAVLVEISANNGQTKFSVLVEPNGTTGSFNLYDKSSGALLGTVNNSTIGWVVSPAGPLQVIAQQVQKSPGEVQQELNYFQTIFNLFNNGQTNPFVPEQRTDNPNPQNTNGTGTQFTVNQPNNPVNPNNSNSPDSIIVTVTPVNTGNGGDMPGPNNANLPELLPQNFPLPLGTTILGSAGNDILTGTAGNDFIFAGAGDDIIIAGHGGGDDFYDGGDGFDTIAFPSANQSITFHLNLEIRDNKLVSTAFNPGETGADVFVDMEKVVGGSGNDVFVLHDRFDWQLDGGAGVDTLRLAENLGFRDYQQDGPEATNFEILDLNDGAGAAFANEVDFDFHGTNEMTAENYIRVIGGANDKINLIDASPEHPDGRWVLLQTFEPPVFGDTLTATVTFDTWVYVSGETTLFTIYVDQDVAVNVIEDINVVVHTEDGYNLSTAYDDLANLDELDIDIEAGTITGESNGKWFVWTVENVGWDGEEFDLSDARITGISVYNFSDYILGDLLLTLEDFDIPVLQLDAALAAYVASEYDDTSALDAIFGNASYNVLGNEGNDVLTGGFYRDVIDGGGGDDTMTGGLGADVFIYNGGNDTVTDFSIASDDRIDLTAFNHIQSMRDIGPLAYYDEESGDTIIDFDNGNTLTLKNVNLDDLTDNDFIFNAPPEVTFTPPINLVEAGENEPGGDVSSTILNVSDANGDKVTFNATSWSAPQGAVAFNGHYYTFDPTPVSWAAARQAALEMGGYLVNITSAGENGFVQWLSFYNSVWIGATDDGHEGTWVWIDGPEAGLAFWTAEDGPLPGAYTNWNVGESSVEPTNGGDGEHFAHIYEIGTWNDVASQTIYGSTAFGYVVEFSTFTRTGVYGSVTYNVDTGELIYTLDNEDPDTEALATGQTVTDNFDLTFVDENGAQTTKTVTFTIEGSNDATDGPNNPPETNEATGSGSEDSMIEIVLSGSDVEDPLSGFRLTTVPPNGQLYADSAGTIPLGDSGGADVPAGEGDSATIYFRPNANWNGSTSFHYVAIDQEGAWGPLVEVPITVAAVNDAPVADPYYFTDRNATTGENFTYTLTSKTFSDIDSGDTLTYSARLVVDGAYETDLPEWLSFDPQTRTFSGTPPAGETGEFEIRVIATDLAGATASESFTLTIEEGEGGNESGTVIVNVESENGLFTPTVYVDLLDADVLTVDESGRIYLVAQGDPQSETGADRYYRVSGPDLGTSMESGELVLTGGTITQIELFSDRGFEIRVANATGYNISATDLQAAIDTYDNGGGAGDYFALFEPYAYVMNGGDGMDILFGGSQNDTLNGSGSSDMLAGMGGDDTLDGGAGLDIINGGTGNDTLTGGGDLDAFIFSPGDGHDTITDFNTEAASPNQDWVTFSGFGELSLGDLTFEDLEGDVTGTIVHITGDQSITFVGVDSLTLQQAAQSTFFFPNT